MPVKARRRSETAIVKKCMALIRECGGYVIKTQPPGVPSGTPDLLACIAGVMYAIEVKRPGNKPTKLQEHRLKQWRDAGAVAVWVDSVDALADLIRHPVYGVDNRTPAL